jgi:uncharacterized protein YdiU (UPF0061 family)
MWKPDVEPNPVGWRFDNSYSRLPEPLFTREKPLPVRHAGLSLFNDAVAAELGLDVAVLRDTGAPIFVGNELPPGAEPLAQAYAGHQFGHFTNLGDGRAILLGEQLTPGGGRVDVQLKGSGRTRYSRGGDGRAVLGPMLREYVISEGMHTLGIPTTRSLAVAATGEAVLRSKPLPGAVLTRVAASHIRVGTFQYAAALGKRDLLAALLDYTIARHAPECGEADEPALAFLEAVAERQASLVARWMLVGFVHGVMNTDNMAVSGETIDYGPCAFLDVYHPDTVFSSIDHGGRYAYANQPTIAQWNLARLAERLLPLLAGEREQAIEKLVAVLETFPERYARHHLAGARAKLGLATAHAGDAALFAELLASMQQAEADFTATFVALARSLDDVPRPNDLPVTAGFAAWLDRWQMRVAHEPGTAAAAAARMRQVNPVISPRNLPMEEALAAAEAGDLAPVSRLLAAITNPFKETSENEPYRVGAPPGSPAYCTFCGT